MDFVGFRVSTAGTRPLQSKVPSILDFPQPVTMKWLLRFLGVVNFYRRWLAKATEVEQPLYELMTTSKKDLEWTPRGHGLL